MALYEHVVLVRQDAAPQQVEALVEQYKGVIEAAGGSVTKIEHWGLRSLAYRISKNRKAHYALLNIDAPYAAVAEVERLEKLSEDVLRSLTLRVEEHEEGQSAILSRKDRDERRGERGERGGFGDRDRGERRPRRDRDDFGGGFNAEEEAE